MIVVYGKSNCPACVDLKRALVSLEKTFDYVDIEKDNEARDEIVSKGFRSVPQVKVNGEWLNNVQEVLF